MSKYNELVKKLKEIFQIDRPELDFGIYRILNARADEINDYLDNKLKAKIQAALKDAGNANKAELEQQLQAAIKAATDAGFEPDQSPKVQDLRKQLAGMASGSVEHENAVFSHLLTFFSRYYDNGDFISKRRYKGDTYAIPYAGEEVMLHWANKDQYYIKSGENFANYAFKLDDGRKVSFKLLAADTAKDNRKDNDADRRFVLIEPHTRTKLDEEGEEFEQAYQPVEVVKITALVNGEAVETEELVIHFEYKAMKKGTKQDALVQTAITTILADSQVQQHWAELAKRAPTESNPSRTELERHLTTYTQRNTADYFIHKDLGGFLTNELDFYIKNEVMNLDNLQNAQVFANIEKQLRMIQCLRAVAQELITFLAQIENFQKKLWNKKKFIVDKNYVFDFTYLPLDEHIYKRILKNDKQINEWIDLFELDVRDLLLKSFSNDCLSFFSNSVYAYLPIDTSLFNQSDKEFIINELRLNDINNLAINGDNYHALNILSEKFKKNISTIYIDPPFNLGNNSSFKYKTDYKDSSWLSMLDSRIELSKKLLNDAAAFYLRCDHNGNYLVKELLAKKFGLELFEGEILVSRIRKNITGQGKISLPLANDSLFLFFNHECMRFVDPFLQLKKTREAYWRRMDDSAGYRNPPERLIFGKLFLPYKKEAHFKYSQESINKMIDEKRIRLKCKTKNCSYTLADGVWSKCPECGSEDAVPQYQVKESNTQILDTNWLDITGYSSQWGFSTENSELLLERALKATTKPNQWVLDFFGGSGTTAAVSHKMNRPWVTVEVGEQFHDVIMPRLKTVIFNDASGISKNYTTRGGAFSYLTIESYEDTLNNISLSKKNTDLFDFISSKVADDYLLKYMLGEESKDSLLNTDNFRKPFNYEMNIATDSAGATERKTIDLVETFNFLIGLHVKSIESNIERGYVRIEGTLPTGERTLILWRDCDKIGYDKLNDYANRFDLYAKEQTFDVIYINGDHNLPTAFTVDGDDGDVLRSLKLRQIEPEFLSLMFAEEA